MDIKTKETYSEVYSILNMLGPNYITKLPVELYQMIKDEKSNEYNPQYDFSILEYQNIKKESLSMIALFHLNYWCSSNEEKQELRDLFNENEIIYQDQLKKKYRTENIVKEETQMPELIIPFTITQEEARKRILNWGKENKKTVEGRSVISSMGNLKGYYLPFRIVKGPVSGEVTRQQTDRKFYIQGYVEENVVNISKQLDNMVLNEIEPFNWNEAKPFEFAYISGQNVKLSELSDKDIQERIFEEVKEEFLPDVEKVMQTTGLDMELESNELLSLSVLLPVYFIKSGKLTLVMNGQTGRIAVYKERKKKRTSLYLLEPIFYTLVISAIITYIFKYDIGMFCLNAFIFGCIFCGIFSQDRTSLFKRIILKTKRTKAERVNKNLEIVEVKENDNIFKNTFDNTPVFFEENKEGKSEVNPI